MSSLSDIVLQMKHTDRVLIGICAGAAVSQLPTSYCKVETQPQSVPHSSILKAAIFKMPHTSSLLFRTLALQPPDAS